MSENFHRIVNYFFSGVAEWNCGMTVLSDYSYVNFNAQMTRHRKRQRLILASEDVEFNDLLTFPIWNLWITQERKSKLPLDKKSQKSWRAISGWQLSMAFAIQTSTSFRWYFYIDMNQRKLESEFKFSFLGGLYSPGQLVIDLEHELVNESRSVLIRVTKSWKAEEAFQTTLKSESREPPCFTF